MLSGNILLDTVVTCAAYGCCLWCRAGARSIDLAPLVQIDQAPLPDVVIVFAQVVGGSGFSYKRNRAEAHALKKAIKRCMLQMLDELPEQEDGRDGYLCRCQEADLKYMVAFRYAHMAVQWCMMVQVSVSRTYSACALVGSEATWHDLGLSAYTHTSPSCCCILVLNGRVMFFDNITRDLGQAVLS